MNTKTQKIFFWTVTGIFSAMMAMSGVMYLTHNSEIVKGFTDGGLPLYLMTLLGIAKFSGAVALLVPKFPKIKEWAYAGFTFNLIGALWVHVSMGQPFIAPLVFLVALGVSYYFNMKVNQIESK